MRLTPEYVKQYFDWQAGIRKIFNASPEELRADMRPEWLALIDKEINEKEED